VPPEVANWNCATWVGIYGTVDNQNVASAGCPAKLILRSRACDANCKESLRSDALFVKRRCPATCGGRPITRAEEKQSHRQKDMPRPLAEFNLGPELSSWDCPKWVSIYGTVDGKTIASAGCLAYLVIKSTACDSRCRESFRENPLFLKNRCPATCGGRRASSSSDSPQSAPNSQQSEQQKSGHANLDMPHPLGEFENAIGPEAAQWNCQQWIGSFGVVDGQTIISGGCRAESVTESRACDVGCKRAFKDDPLFMSRRCPQTCAAGPSIQATVIRVACVIVLVLALIILCLVAALVHICTRRHSQGVRVVDAADAPLCEDGDFSEFEGAEPTSTWVDRAKATVGLAPSSRQIRRGTAEIALTPLTRDCPA